KRAMADRLPPSVVGGKKRGFNVPMPAWLARDPREVVQDTPAPGPVRAPGPFDPRALPRPLHETRTRPARPTPPLRPPHLPATRMDEVLGTRSVAVRAAGGMG